MSFKILLAERAEQFSNSAQFGESDFLSSHYMILNTIVFWNKGGQQYPESFALWKPMKKEIMSDIALYLISATDNVIEKSIDKGIWNRDGSIRVDIWWELFCTPNTQYAARAFHPNILLE